jgi:UDPglucose 6-dehydrogenase
VESLGEHCQQAKPPLVVCKCTVPVGTAREVLQRLQTCNPAFDLVWNPEFLREGKAVTDSLKPDRLVYGTADQSERSVQAVALLDQVYKSITAPRLQMNYQTAELVKVAANSFLALKISFINSVSAICDATAADVSELAKALGLDERIGKHFLGAGIGYGGGCLPKDVSAFLVRANELGLAGELGVLKAAEAANQAAQDRHVDKLKQALGGSLADRTIAVFGATFKPETDDTRSSPAVKVVQALLNAGASIRWHDPMLSKAVIDQIDSAARDRVFLADTPQSAVEGADGLTVLTDWALYKKLDPAELAEHTDCRLVVDGRNCLDPIRWVAAGWSYQGAGRAFRGL